MPASARFLILFAVFTAFAQAGRAGQPVPSPQGRAVPAIPMQRLEQPVAAGEGTLRTEHFDIVYRPGKVTAEQSEQAGREAEAAWVRCTTLFGAAPPGRVRLDLSPDFFGATGFARRGDPESRDPRKRPLIGVRYADLEYLGLTGPYVLTHEVAHLFSDELAPTALGEGIADWGAGGFSGIAMRPWWGRALREAGLWIEPEAFFITGEFAARPEVDEVIRTAQYVESGLLVRFLVERFGWEKFRAFALEYGRARGALNSNEERKALKPRRLREKETDPRALPDASAVRGVFEKHFGESWDKLRAEWEQTMESDRAEPGEAERLVLGQKLYGAVRNWEMWVLEQRPGPSAKARERVREAFTRANRALQGGSVTEAEQALAEARVLVEQLRRPRIVT